jgi:glucose-1-phosphate thymidylyltransferase
VKGIILHGGHGTRLRPLTHTGPKQLLPIGNKPMSEYGLEKIIEAGISDIAIVIGGIGSNKVKDYYGNGEKYGVKISYVEQEFPKGIAHAINLCKEFIGNEKFLVFLGDNIIKKSIADYAKDFEIGDSEASIMLCEVDNPTQFGIAEIFENKIIKIMEKPKNPPSNLAVIGIYFLTPTIFEIIEKLKPSWRNELEITDALDMLLKEKHEISYYKVTDYWKDTGTPEDILHANKLLLEDMKSYVNGDIEEGVKVTGKVIIGKNSIIKKDTKLVGPIIIGENCIISNKAELGPNISLGNNSKISGCRIKNSIIMENTEINCNENIQDSIIASNSIISSSENPTQKKLLLGEGTRITL